MTYMINHVKSSYHNKHVHLILSILTLSKSLNWFGLL